MGIIKIPWTRFVLIYLLLLVVLFVMKKCRINKTKMLVVASVRMTVQLIIAGFILTYVINANNHLFVIIYILVMATFSSLKVFKGNHLSDKFKVIIGLSILFSGLLVECFYVGFVIRKPILDAQYAIPISGMLFGNTMTAVNLGVNYLNENLKLNKNKITTLINLGVSADTALIPIVNKSVEMAILPNLNSMIAMGIISLPGMMTGQILSGVSPNTAIIYQISVMIAICASVNIASFLSLYLGYKSLINNREQINFEL